MGGNRAEGPGAPLRAGGDRLNAPDNLNALFARALVDELCAAGVREVFEAQGTNLVYGGRQLGKTALLRDVERRYRDLDRGVVVRWIDLKKEDVGYDRPADDVWAVLGKALRPIAQGAGLVPILVTLQ